MYNKSLTVHEIWAENEFVTVSPLWYCYRNWKVTWSRSVQIFNIVDIYHYGNGISYLEYCTSSLSWPESIMIDRAMILLHRQWFAYVYVKCNSMTSWWSEMWLLDYWWCFNGILRVSLGSSDSDDSHRPESCCVVVSWLAGLNEAREQRQF